MIEEDTKACLICGETIHASARKCIHCDEFIDGEEQGAWRKWTGFQDKTLWDWMSLLIVPLVLALGGFWLSDAQESYQFNVEATRVAAQSTVEAERAAAQSQIEADRFQANAVQAYFDQMTELLLQGLRASGTRSELRSLAEARTLSILRTVDQQRKREILYFLYESDLIQRSTPVVALRYADLSFTDLTGALLRGADLRLANLAFAELGFADLTQADLAEAVLIQADLSEANLSEASLAGALMWQADLSEARLNATDLTNADLKNANLEGADLRSANLTGATLGPTSTGGTSVWTAASGVVVEITGEGANFAQADLRGADFSRTDLSMVNLTGASFNRDTVWPDGFDPVAAGAILVDEEREPREGVEGEE